MENNILAKILGEHLGAASAGFPPAATATVETMEAEMVDVDGRQVIVTYERRRHRHHKTVLYSWGIRAARYAT